MLDFGWVCAAGAPKLLRNRLSAFFGNKRHKVSVVALQAFVCAPSVPGGLGGRLRPKALDAVTQQQPHKLVCRLRSDRRRCSAHLMRSARPRGTCT